MIKSLNVINAYLWKIGPVFQVQNLSPKELVCSLYYGNIFATENILFLPLMQECSELNVKTNFM